MKKSICILGGDSRNYELAKILNERDYVVKTYDEKYNNIEAFLEGASCVVCGIPFSRDGETINAPNIKERISIEKLFISMKNCKVLIAGNFSDKIHQMAIRYDVKLCDFLDDEDFAVYNAIPTAEGAVEIAMKNTEKTINSSNCLILGFGRIGKVLADVLKGLHANVIVVARKDKDFAWIKALGYNCAKYSELKNVLPKTDILLNTVPSMVIGREELDAINKDCIIIDLASKPGGIDFEYAKQKSIKVEWALGLPGKVAPKSVAEYMLNKVINVN